jgi:hypothetical protein
MTNQKILIEIGLRLNTHKTPTETQRKFLRHLGAALEDGLSIEEALSEPEPTPEKSGKRSDAYRVAKLKRNMRYRQAFDLLTGSPWSRCSQIVQDLSHIRFALDRNELLPDNEYTLLLTRSIKSGIKPVSTTRQLYKILLKN